MVKKTEEIKSEFHLKVLKHLNIFLIKSSLNKDFYFQKGFILDLPAKPVWELLPVID